jgi:elongation factor Ts
MDVKLIAQLRDKTGAGFGDCKAALDEAGWDLDKAVEIMRKKGEAKAIKKSERVVKEGVVAVAKGEGKIAVAALACETDFVSRGEDFQTAAKELAEKLLNSTEEEFKAWSAPKIQDLVLKIGENIQLTGQGIFSGEVIGTYIHSNKKIVGVCIFDQGSEEIASDIAMQIAAMSPRWLAPAEIDAEIIDKEKEIYREQLKGENKPEQIWDKIIDGKLAKFYEENCLLNQIFVKDDTKKIKDLLGDSQIVKWARFSV